MIEHDEQKCETCQHVLCARSVPIFSVLDHAEIKKVVSLIVRRKYGRGETIVAEGSYPESLIIIKKGRVKAFRYNSEGKEQILYIFSEGDFLGEKNLLRNQQVSYNVEALEDTNICIIKKKEFQNLLMEHPTIGFKIIEELCARIERLENAVQSMGTKSVDTRINEVILEFGRKYGKETKMGIEVQLPLSREGIASYIGVTRETVSRKFSHLQDEGIIQMVGNKKVIIVDKAKLEETSEL
jgi:CRP/FNR family transcriptional regulator, anaerobic regulatory protein